MTPRVREILSWYGADCAGTLTNLARPIVTDEAARFGISKSFFSRLFAGGGCGIVQR